MTYGCLLLLFGKKSGVFLIVLNLDGDLVKKFSSLDCGKVYSAHMNVRKECKLIIARKDAFLRRVPSHRNINGTPSDETLLIEFRAKDISRQHLATSEISVKVGGAIETDHPLLSVVIKG